MNKEGEAMEDIKKLWDEFYDTVSDITMSLIQDEQSTEMFTANYQFVKDRLIEFNDQATQDQMKNLAETNLPDFVNWLQISTCISSISNCMDHTLFKQTVIKPTENSESKAKALH